MCQQDVGFAFLHGGLASRAPGPRLGAVLGFGTASLSAMAAIPRSGAEPFLLTMPSESICDHKHNYDQRSQRWACAAPACVHAVSMISARKRGHVRHLRVSMPSVQTRVQL